MKFFCRALCVLTLVLTVARAADDEDAATFGDYAPTAGDDLIQYIPKYTVRLGFRAMSGVKSGFFGNGFLTSPELIGDPNGVAARAYHDGYVNLDTRTVFDPAGNQVPIQSDGKTNNWSYTDPSQVGTGAYTGLMAMHSYTAQVTDSSIHEKDPALGLGVELALERDMGKILRSRVQWSVIGGMSVNQFSAITRSAVAADVTTTTDYYSLFGQQPPTVLPYIGPENSGGVDTSTLLGNTVLARVPTTVATTDAVFTDWHLRGSYMTFRGGPSVLIPVGRRFTATLSAGAVLVYAGSTYEVTQSFKPQTGDEITQTTTDGASKLLPGFYVDANLQWSINETSGLYFGAVYQNSGDYVQTIESSDGKSAYSTRVDLSSLQGIRAGVSFKF